MKTLFTNLLMFATLFTGSLNASAAVDPKSLPSIRLIEIKAEYYPGETYYLGYAENDDHSINSVFYENHEHQKRYFSFQQLKKDIAIIQTTSGGTVYDLVRMNIVRGEESNTYIVTMSYMRNGLFKTRKEVEFLIRYNKRRSVYELVNSDEQLITRAYVTTNYWGSIAVGINKITTSR